MIITINVTQEDINAGKRNACELCPVALSVKRMFPKRTIYVDTRYIVIDLLGFVIPIEARDFITAFDAGRPVKPFSFPLEIPDGLEVKHGN